MQDDFVGLKFHPVEGTDGQVKFRSVVENLTQVGGLKAFHNPSGQRLVVGLGGGEADGEVFVGHDGVEGGHAIEVTALEAGIPGLV